MGSIHALDSNFNEVPAKKECPVCFAEFSPSDSRLKLLTCTHEICGACVRKIDKCPSCRETINFLNLENAEFIKRRGFNCSTCETRRTSDKMRICATCAEEYGVKITPEALSESSAFIFCSECIIEDHINQSHRYEKLMNYDHEYIAIKEMQTTCLLMKPILGRLIDGSDDSPAYYRKIMKATTLVLSPNVDLHFTQLKVASAAFRKCLETVNEDADLQRKYASIWNDLSKTVVVDDAEKIERGEQLCYKQKFEEAIQAQQRENELKAELQAIRKVVQKLETERAAQMSINQKKLKEQIRSQKSDTEKLKAELQESRTIVKTLLSNPEYVERLTTVSTELCTLSPTSSIHSLYLTVNKPMLLCGITFFAAQEKSDSNILVNMTRLGASSVITCQWKWKVPFLSKDSKHNAEQYGLTKPFQLNPGSKYLIEMKVDKEVIVRQGLGGKSSIKLPLHPEYVMEFTSYGESETTVAMGQFAGFQVVPIA